MKINKLKKQTQTLQQKKAMASFHSTELLAIVQMCQQLLSRVSEQLQQHESKPDTDYKQKYETLLGERVHLLNELGQLLLERERNNRPMYFMPSTENNDIIKKHKRHKNTRRT